MQNAQLINEQKAVNKELLDGMLILFNAAKTQPTKVLRFMPELRQKATTRLRTFHQLVEQEKENEEQRNAL